MSILTIIEQDGPAAVSFIETHGPQVYAAFSPLIGKSISAGTLETDAAAAMAALGKIGGMLGPLLQGSANKGSVVADIEAAADVMAQLVPGLGTAVTLGELVVNVLAWASSINPDTQAVPEANAVSVGMDNGDVQPNAKNGGV